MAIRVNLPRTLEYKFLNEYKFSFLCDIYSSANCKEIILSKNSQSQKDIYCMIPYIYVHIYNLWNIIIELENRLIVDGC